jgi:hypothetical protein
MKYAVFPCIAQAPRPASRMRPKAPWPLAVPFGTGGDRPSRSTFDRTINIFQFRRMTATTLRHNMGGVMTTLVPM